MDLYAEIIMHMLSKGTMEVRFPDCPIEPKEIVEMYSYAALKRIKQILEDDRLSDQDCFFKIEEIVNVFETMESGCASRHDF